MNEYCTSNSPLIMSASQGSPPLYQQQHNTAANSATSSPVNSSNQQQQQYHLHAVPPQASRAQPQHQPLQRPGMQQQGWVQTKRESGQQQVFLTQSLPPPSLSQQMSTHSCSHRFYSNEPPPVAENSVITPSSIKSGGGEVEVVSTTSIPKERHVEPERKYIPISHACANSHDSPSPYQQQHNALNVSSTANNQQQQQYQLHTAISQQRVQAQTQHQQRLYIQQQPPMLTQPPPPPQQMTYIGSHRFYANEVATASSAAISSIKPSEGSSASTGGTPKERYRELKRKFMFLVYENEYYQEELRNLQRKLLKLSRDKNFLLDRLGGYENLSDSSDDSDGSIKTLEERVVKPKRKPQTRKRAPASDANNGIAPPTIKRRASAGIKPVLPSNNQRATNEPLENAVNSSGAIEPNPTASISNDLITTTINNPSNIS